MNAAWVRRCAVLGCTLLLASVGFAPVEANSPTALFTPHNPGDPIPEPPRQRAPWVPPSSGLADSFVSAARLLFDLGMADPRGCEYREVVLPLGNGLTIETHAWVLPPRAGDPRRFAVGLNGLVYPTLSVGPRADLVADVRGAPRPAPVRGDFRWLLLSLDSASLDGPTHTNLDDTAVCLLLRLGEGQLATRLWCRLHPALTEPNAAAVPDPYRGLARQWTERLYNQGADAHSRGDDLLARHALRLLQSAAVRVEAEARRRSNPGEEVEPVVTFAAQAAELMADQQRRMRRRLPEPLVCVGPGKHPAAPRRIAGLVARLDEATGSQMSWYVLSGSAADPVTRGLVAEGEAAVEPLLDRFEKDDGLTRSAQDWRASQWGCFGIGSARTGTRTVVPISETAERILSQILSPNGFVSTLQDDRPLKDPAKRKAVADEIRGWLRKNRGIPVAERWFNVLADDKAGPGRWHVALEHLVEIDKGLRPREAPLRFRDRVTSLAVRRVEQITEHDVAARFGMVLARWDPAARLVLPGLMKRCAEADRRTEILELVETRVRLGDWGGLDDYAAWVRTLPPTLAKDGQARRWLEPLHAYAHHPAVADAGEWLFNDPASPWVPMLQRPREDFPTQEVLDLLRPDMLRVPGLRRAVLRHLADRSLAGKAEWQVRQSISIEVMGLPARSYSRSAERGPTESGAGEVRVCDFVAWLLAEHAPAAPAFEPWWPLERRDRSVRQCAEFLRRFPGAVDFPRPVRAATPEDVRDGRAIFSLQGEGLVRTVPLPNHPQIADWITLTAHPYFNDGSDDGSGRFDFQSGYSQDGLVHQAEEVFRDGKWHRYYGFAGVGRVERVPAEEIEFPARGLDAAWQRLDSSFDVLLQGPVGAPALGEGEVIRLPGGSTVPMRLMVRNRRGLDQPTPPLDGVSVRVWHSPEKVSPGGELVASARTDAAWTELKLRADAAWRPRESTFGPAEEQTVCDFDLRERFDLSRPGFYRVRLRVGVVDQVAQPPELRFSLSDDNGRPAP